MWVRGLKRSDHKGQPKNPYVASHVGAWIETRPASELVINNTSHPMWVRGLKLILIKGSTIRTQSHPMWVRGLKHANSNRLYTTLVASHVGAWIETPLLCKPSF